MSKKYDGWCMQNEDWDHLDTASFHRYRTNCIARFISNSRWSWRQFKARGWRCIKVKLVPVSEEAS